MYRLSLLLCFVLPLVAEARTFHDPEDPALDEASWTDFDQVGLAETPGRELSFDVDGVTLTVTAGEGYYGWYECYEGDCQLLSWPSVYGGTAQYVTITFSEPQSAVGIEVESASCGAAIWVNDTEAVAEGPDYLGIADVGSIHSLTLVGLDSGDTGYDGCYQAVFDTLDFASGVHNFTDGVVDERRGCEERDDNHNGCNDADEARACYGCEGQSYGFAPLLAGIWLFARVRRR